MRIPDIGTIELNGMRFHAFHGCLPAEREQGAEYLVDFRCRCDISRAEESDDLADTLDYSRIYDLVAAEMAVPSNLLEHVAGRIRDAIEREFPDIPEFEVGVCKLAPPVGGAAAMAKLSVKGGTQI